MMSNNSTSAPSHWLTSLLLSLLSLGVGVLGGFGLLYGQYSAECAKLVQHTESQASQSSRQWQQQFKQVQKAHDTCVKQESTDLRACQVAQNKALDAHSALVLKHQTLLQEHGAALDKVTVAQREAETHQLNIHSLQEQIKRLQRESGQSTIHAEQARLQLEQRLQHVAEQLNVAQSLLQQKTREAEQLQAQVAEAGGGVVFASSQALQELKRDVQRQHLAQLTLLRQRQVPQYRQGPFQVEFTLDVSSGDPPELSLHTFVVELSSAEYFSMTIHTFLKLIHAGLFVGTTIGQAAGSGNSLAQDFLLTGGNPQHAATKRVRANLTRRLAEHGYGMEPFLWLEQAATNGNGGSSTATCQTVPGAFWFASRSPQFHIALPPHNPHSQQPQVLPLHPSCHGRIVSGLATLQQVFVSTQPHHPDHRPPLISNVQILHLHSDNEGSANGGDVHEEL